MQPHLQGMRPELLAQVQNTFDWWATTGGVLGAIVFVTGFVVIFAMREWWKVRKPHVIAKQEMELEKEQKTLGLLSTLTDSQVADQHFKQRQVASQEQMTNLLEKIDDRQSEHDSTCGDTHKLVQDIHKKLNGG